MLFYIKAKLNIKVAGISGHSQEAVSGIINNVFDELDAIRKFENHCKRKYSKMEPEYIKFEYLEIAPEIV